MSKCDNLKMAQWQQLVLKVVLLKTKFSNFAIFKFSN